MASPPACSSGNSPKSAPKTCRGDAATFSRAGGRPREPWLTDFRDDLPKIDIPTLVVHGTADRILPFGATAARLRDEHLIADLTVVGVENGPHNIGWTYPDETNAAILEFLSGGANAETSPAAEAISA